jgi:YD repeat-containing protein
MASVTYPDLTTRVYHWDEASNVVSPPNGVSLLTGITDELNQRFSTYKYSGRYAKSTERAGGTLRYEISQFQPQYTTIIDPLGGSRTYNVAAYGGLTRVWNITSWCKGCIQGATYDTNGNQTTRTDFNGKTTCLAYDLTRNLETKRVEGVSGTGSCPAALTSPSAGARVISTQWHPDWRLETKIAEPNKLTTVVYNGQGATCAPSTVLVDGKPPAVVCSRTEQATTDASGALGFAAGLTGTARTWSYTYTTYGRLLSATDPNGKTTTTTYYADDDPDLGRRGNVATVTNPANHLTRYSAYNLHGQPTQIVDANGLTTDLTYDLRLRLTSRKVGTELTTFTYDPRGLLTKVTLPDAAAVTYTYDAAHRLTQIADQRGNKITYTLDAIGNRISEKATDTSGSLVRNIQRSIDALNRVQQMSGVQ